MRRVIPVRGVRCLALCGGNCGRESEGFQKVRACLGGTPHRRGRSLRHREIPVVALLLGPAVVVSRARSPGSRVYGTQSPRRGLLGNLVSRITNSREPSFRYYLILGNPPSPGPIAPGPSRPGETTPSIYNHCAYLRSAKSSASRPISSWNWNSAGSKLILALLRGSTRSSGRGSPERRASSFSQPPRG